MKFKITDYSTREVFKELYDGSAWTWEGLKFDEHEAQLIADSFVELGLVIDGCEQLEFFVTSGKAMNDNYKLTGDNAYKDDLHIVSIPLECLNGNAILAKLQMGARWFDDIVDNNARREQKKRG